MTHSGPESGIDPKLAPLSVLAAVIYCRRKAREKAVVVEV
jgi:hypothetical protein